MPAGPFGEDVGEDPAVMLGGQLGFDAGGPGDVDAVHPDVAGESHVEQVAQRLPADVHAEPAPDRQDGQGADRCRHAPAGPQRGRGVPLPRLRQHRRRPAGACPQLRLVEPVDPVLPADLLGEPPAREYLAGELDRVRLCLRQRDQVDDDVPDAPAGAVGGGLPLLAGEDAELGEQARVLARGQPHGLVVVDGGDPVRALRRGDHVGSCGEANWSQWSRNRSSRASRWRV